MFALGAAAVLLGDVAPRTCPWTTIQAATDLGLSDRNATYAWYWTRLAPDDRIEIEGAFPRSRYMSLVLQDQNGLIVDSIDDVEIRPTSGRNPFRPGTRRDRAPAPSYRVQVVASPIPASGRAPNTLYGGRTLAGEENRLLLISFRNYLTDRRYNRASGHAHWATGGHPPPRIRHSRAGQPAPCPDPQAARSEWLARQASTATQVRGVAAVPGQRQPMNPPEWFHSERASLRATNLLGPNDSTVYVSTAISSRHGPLLVLRWRPPVTPLATYDGAPFPARSDMRYWSISFMRRVEDPSFGGIRTVQSIADVDLPRLADGTARLVIGFEGVERPPGVPANQWVSLPFSDGTMMVREIMTSPSYPLDLGKLPRGVVPSHLRHATPGGIYVTAQELAERPDL